MIKLDQPIFSIEQAITECSNGITGNAQLKENLNSSKSELICHGNSYLSAAIRGELHTISPISNNTPDPNVVKNLRKSDLIKLYDNYFVGLKKPGRVIYDSILSSAKDKCPFCGGIGKPRNLDHFLPKAHFPQFSVLPQNLVPSCRDCNMDGKSQNFATTNTDLLIQPYTDNDRFFTEQWIYATFQKQQKFAPGVFEYKAIPPHDWTEGDKHRAENHFTKFNLALRYSIKAAEQLNMTMLQIKKHRELNLNDDDIISALLQPGIDESPFANHWQHGMYQALIKALPNISM